MPGVCMNQLLTRLADLLDWPEAGLLGGSLLRCCRWRGGVGSAGKRWLGAGTAVGSGSQ